MSLASPVAATPKKSSERATPFSDVTACTRVGSVGDVLTEDGPFDVLVAGPSLGTRAGLTRLEVIHDELPGMSVLLAFNRRPEARLREIVRTGAIDLLQLPAKDDDLLESVQRAIELSRHELAGAPAQAGSLVTKLSCRDGLHQLYRGTRLEDSNSGALI